MAVIQFPEETKRDKKISELLLGNQKFQALIIVG
jgi:hypothetical protein